MGRVDASSTGEIAPARPRLRLVRRDEEEIGPISPETVLVCPGLREAALEAEPNTPRWAVSPAAAADEERDGGASGTGDEPELGPAAYDTPDLRLRRHGLTLERWASGESSRWKLELPRGEVVVSPGERPGGGVPARIARLVRAVAGGQELEAMPRQSDHPDFAHLQDMVWAQCHAMLAHDPGVRLGADPENLHQFRVATRRLRAFARVARTLVAKEWAAALRAELGESGRFTGPVRDLDVLLEHLTGEIETLDDAERPAGNVLIAELETERDTRRQELARWLEDRRYFALLDRLRLPVRAARRPRGSLAALAARELDLLVGDVTELGAAPDDASFHALRIRVKRVRYAVELAGRPAKRRTRKLLAAARSLQDLLGEHQDAVVAEDRLRAFAEPDDGSAVAFVAGRLAERQRLRRERVRQQFPSAWRKLRRAARQFRR